MKTELDRRFAAYWGEIAKCRAAGAFWSLLHVTVCLPDICAALQSSDGKTTGDRYRNWCEKFAPDPLLTGEERWQMRNKLLHQGRGKSGGGGRYNGFSFSSPTTTGQVDHMRVEKGILHLDVGELAQELKGAVDKWIEWLDANPGSSETDNVRKNLTSMVEVTRVVFRPAGGSAFISARTN